VRTPGLGPHLPPHHSQVALGIVIFVLIFVCILTCWLWGSDTGSAWLRTGPSLPTQPGTWGPRRTLVLVARHTVGFRDSRRETEST
jgi:hypothetical protein